MSARSFFLFLHRHRLLHFVLTGGSGALLNLGVTGLLTELIFGRDHYFPAYLVGLLVNFIYNFALHTHFTFSPGEGHARRFVLFLLYNSGMTLLQALLVKVLVRMFGTNYYLVVIAFVILTFSSVTYLCYRFLLFRSDRD